MSSPRKRRPIDYIVSNNQCCKRTYKSNIGQMIWLYQRAHMCIHIYIYMHGITFSENGHELEGD